MKHKKGAYVRVIGSGTRIVAPPWIGTITRVEEADATRSGFYVVVPVTPRPAETMEYCWNEWQVEGASLLDALADAAQ